MDSVTLAILEFTIFLGGIILFFKAFEAIDISQIFKKGFTLQIRIVYIAFVIISSYLFTQAIMVLFTLFSDLKGI